MAYTVVLEQQFSDNFDTDQACDSQTVRLTLTVTSFTDLEDGGIFVYVVDPVTGVERYDHVAVPCDLQRYNLDVTGGLEFVRKDELELYYPSSTEAEEGRDSIFSSVQDLLNELQAASTLSTAVTTTFTGV